MSDEGSSPNHPGEASGDNSTLEDISGVATASLIQGFFKMTFLELIF